MKTRHITIILLACCVLFTAVGCGNKDKDGKSGVNASSGGRDIHVLADGAAWVGPQENQFTVKLTGHEIIIGLEQVLVDNRKDLILCRMLCKKRING